MSKKSHKIAELIRPFQGQPLDPHYLAYFHCFERQQFFEAHEVLEQLWLPERLNADGPFFKGLIQLAGAFVHLQKGRLGPAAALFRLAKGSLGPYAGEGHHHHLHVAQVLSGIQEWLTRLGSSELTTNLPLTLPELQLKLVG